MKKINSTDIAKLAGVSRSTVSRVINGYSNVPDKTRQRVMKVIEEHGYYPSLSGQMLAGKSTGTIGFFWIDSGNIAEDILASSFFVHVIEAAAELGYLVLSCIRDNLSDAENINYVKRIFMQGRIDAGVFIGVNNYNPFIENLIKDQHIVGMFDHFHPNKQERNRVSVNFETNTGDKVIDYICSLGHQKIAVIDGNMNRYSAVQRHEGFIRGMQKHNIEIKGHWMRYGIGYEGGYQSTKELIASANGDLPTAICANNDGTAFGAYRAIQEAGLRIPQHISVIGIDGDERSNYASPPLTTFAFNYKDMFTSLVSRTVAAIEDKEHVPLTDYITSRLIERESCISIT